MRPSLRHLVRALVPFPLRVAWVRRRHARAFREEHPRFLLPRGRVEDFPFVLAAHRSPLRRRGADHGEALQRGKEVNVARAAALVDGAVLAPGAVFSYHHAVGEPSARRGFVHGAELHDGALRPGLGGGCCQVSNLLHVLALLSGAAVIERHRHGFDLFPDVARAVPFGCGATVFFPHRDLRFRNTLAGDVLLSLGVEGGELVGAARTREPPPVTWELFEVDGSIRFEGGRWVRENRVGRRPRGAAPGDFEVVAHNVAVCRYDPSRGA